MTLQVATPKVWEAAVRATQASPSQDFHVQLTLPGVCPGVKTAFTAV